MSISFAYTSYFTSHPNCTGHANNESKEKAGDSVQNIVSSLRERPLDPRIQDVNYIVLCLPSSHGGNLGEAFRSMCLNDRLPCHIYIIYIYIHTHTHIYIYIYIYTHTHTHITGEGNGTPLQYSCLENPMDGGAWKAAVHGVAEGRTRLSDFTFIFHFPALEKEMATHSSVLAWRIPGTGEPGGLSSMGSHRVGHD